MVAYAWGGFGAAFGPLIILALCWKGVSWWGSLSGVLSGSVTIFVVKNFVKIPGEYFYELMPGFIISFVITVLISLITKKPSKETLEVFDQTLSELA
ncbi:MAG TPA: sodium:proline symporter, partial [Treponemataceae bacterium]|nr:sodium:proline symporter [Treponemataceae bacterium]